MYILLLFFLVSCEKKHTIKEIEQSIIIKEFEAKKIKQTLIDGYSKNSSNILDYSFENFKKFVLEEKITGTYYDDFIHGYLLKRFYLETYGYAPCVVKCDDNYHYFAIDDHNRYFKMLNYSFGYGDGYYGLENQDTLSLYYDSLSLEVKYFQNIISSDTNSTITASAKYYFFENLFYNLYRLSYLSDSKHSINKVSNQYMITKHDLTKMYKRDMGVDTNNLKYILSEIEILEKSNFGLSYFFVDNFGIIILCFEQNGNSFKVRKYFIPQLEIAKIFPF